MMNLIEFEKRLDAAILNTMETDVAYVVRDEMSRHLESYDYRWSRGPYGMGVRDKRNFDAKAVQIGDVTTLRVRDNAVFQTGKHGSKSLAMVVETGDPAFKMPEPRPFLAPTQEIMDAGAAEAALAQGLRKRGL